MKQIVVLSGKGGTGKTTVSAALAHLASQSHPVVLADTDVGAANLELLLDARKRETVRFVSGKEASIDPALCSGCGRCAEVCRFGAVFARDGLYAIDPIRCEGCASCFYQCPSEAIVLTDREAGLWFRSDSRYGTLFHAHLYAGQENSGKLVSTVKQQAVAWAAENPCDYVIVDGPPGIGCPVISACAGADLALMVTEPTVSGAHDLGRVLATAAHFGVPAAILINKCDINERRSQEISEFAAERHVPVLERIPYDLVMTQAAIHGLPVTEFAGGVVTRLLTRAWEALRDLVETR